MGKLKSHLIAIAIAIGTPSGVFAQDAFEVGGLGGIDPWGIGWVSQREGAFPTTVWQNSSPGGLMSAMREVEGVALTPSTRKLLTTLVRSPARAPDGNDTADLLQARANLLMQLGYASEASELIARANLDESGMSREMLEADQALAYGNDASACGIAEEGTPPDHPFWRQMQVTCFTLAGNTPSADLALEFAIEAGVNDEWFFAAIGAAGAPDIKPTITARFDSGINIALSLAADLPLGEDYLHDIPDGYLTALTNRPDLDPAQQLAFADAAAARGVISVDDHLAAYDGFRARGEEAKDNLIVKAFESMDNIELSSQERAEAFALALNAHEGNRDAYGAAFNVMADQIQRLPRAPETASYALTFLRAAAAANNRQAFQRWEPALHMEDTPDATTREVAILEALLVLNGEITSKTKIEGVALRLMEVTRESKDRETAADLLLYWEALDIHATPEIRDFIRGTNFNSRPEPLDGYRIATSLLAMQSGAVAEGVLTLIPALGSDLTVIRSDEMAAILSSLRRAGQLEISRDMAEESLGIWSK